MREKQTEVKSNSSEKRKWKKIGTIQESEKYVALMFLKLREWQITNEFDAIQTIVCILRRVLRYKLLLLLFLKTEVISYRDHTDRVVFCSNVLKITPFYVTSYSKSIFP